MLRLVGLGLHPLHSPATKLLSAVYEFRTRERGPWRRVASVSVSCWPGCGGRCRRRTAAAGTALRPPGQVSSCSSRAARCDTASAGCRRARLSAAQPTAPHIHAVLRQPMSFATKTRVVS